MTDQPARRPAPENPDPFRRLVEIMDRLLAPDGCPWDREQSHRTLKPYVVEEAYEVCEAIDEEDWDELRAELGDLGLQIVFHSALARREGRFDVDAVYAGICEKLVRRHPHVFGDTVVEGSGEVLRNWESIKRAERDAKRNGEEDAPASVLEGVPRALPGLQRAARLQSKAAKVGFDWGDIAPVWEKLHEEIEEVREAAASGDPDKLEDEFGDLLFAAVNLSRFLKVEAEEAAHRASAKFTRRFQALEERARAEGRPLERMTLDEMDRWWEDAKRAEK